MMIAILAITYCVGLYLVFVRFRLIPFTLTAQILSASVGVIGLFVMLLQMNYTQPFSIGSTVSGLATQIEARVPGKITEVDVKDGTSVKRGDVLFRMDPQPYASQLQQAKATYVEAQIKSSTAIQQATQNVNAATAQVQGVSAQIASTEAAINATKTQLALTETRLNQYTELKEKNAGSLFEVEKYQSDVKSTTDQIAAQTQGLAAQQQQLVAAEAQLAQAKTSLQEAIKIQPELLAGLKAHVAAAQWSVDQTTAVAGDDGYVTQVTVQPGTMVSVGPVMVLVNERANPLLLVTVMQNYVNVIRPGQPAEVAVPTLPGRILHASVVRVEKATGSGALYPEGRLKSSYQPLPPDRMFVVLNLQDDLKGALIPVGSTGWVSIKGDEQQGLFVIRQVIMRWYTWLNYIFPGY